MRFETILEFGPHDCAEPCMTYQKLIKASYIAAFAKIMRIQENDAAPHACRRACCQALKRSEGLTLCTRPAPGTD